MLDLNTFVLNVKKYLVSIEQGNDDFALFFLLLASFVYGFIHALGPGHGKALAFSYFSAQKSSFTKAFFISFLTAFIHILGAFILVVASIFILKSTLGNFVANSISYTTSLSAVFIMILSLYMLYVKLYKKSCHCSSCNIDIKPVHFSSNVKNEHYYIKTHSNKKFISIKQNKKQDLFFILTAGIVPCPGTVLLFTYAFLLKTYFSVILASIFISLGMGVVIFFSSFLGVSLNDLSSKSRKMKDILEISAPIFMFFLGLLLLLNFY